MGLRVWAAVAAMAVTACREPELCTQSGCVWEPWIRVADDGTADGRLRAGDYVFRIDSPHVVVEWSCAVAGGDVPDPACDRSHLLAMGELDGEPVRWDVEASHESDGLHVGLVEIRDDGATWAGPDQFTVAVSRDGEAVVVSMHRPEYIGQWPNGVECGMYCARATEPVVVRVPP
ncbi:hypothetical protein [Nannocystis radixulma]|uniref:Lipoprotein n=1 Tax=Nannocystis radixulma TaxID=2995305 RepID=A0ABT5AYU5_9BACT|nr:hypothetical protein [Nannocystis radixulma]MDC0667003.1 hypothetical protein [Nannocystis radixulma]